MPVGSNSVLRQCRRHVRYSSESDQTADIMPGRFRARKRPEQMQQDVDSRLPPRISLYEIRVLAACSAGYAALFAAATLAPTTRALNSSTVITSAVENASIVNVARWTSAADSAP